MPPVVWNITRPRTVRMMSRTGAAITAIRIFFRPLSCRRRGGVTPSSTPSRGAAHRGHTFQSSSTGAEQPGQEGRSLAPHWGHTTYCSATGAAHRGHSRSE